MAACCNSFFLFIAFSFFFASFCLAETPPGTPSEPIPVEAFLRPSTPFVSRVEKHLVERSFSKEDRKKLHDLGFKLFFDPRLSGSGLMSCATCHNPSFYWTDSLKNSVENTHRKSMSFLNIGHDTKFTWDGSAVTIASMMLLPITASGGMSSNAHHVTSIITEINGYQKVFDEVFGPHMSTKKIAVDFITVAVILEYYISSLESPISRFDEYVSGKREVFSRKEEAGFELFRGKANCASCHSTWRLSDGEVYDIGLKIESSDPVFFKTGKPLFKAVGLRAIASRPPYMHTGKFNTLEEVIDFYNRGGDIPRTTVSDKIKPLHLTEEEKEQLKAFMIALDEEPPQVNLPVLPR